MKKIIKIIIIVAVIGAILYFGAQFFMKPSVEAVPDLVSSNGEQVDGSAVSDTGVNGGESDVGNEFVGLLLNMRNIKLDSSLFTKPSFKSLENFTSVLIPEGDEGRANPFAPIGQDSSQIQTSFSVETSPVAEITATGAIINGLLPDGVIAIERWFEWGTIQKIPLANVTTKVSQSGVSGVFSYTLAGLFPNTTYYTRAVAKIGTTIVYGTTATFKTLSTATLVPAD